MKNKDIQNLSVIIQCRLSSTRLPEKALKKLGGKTIFEWTMDSMKKVPAGHYIVVTDDASYPELLPLAKNHGWKVITGPLDDVLERFCIAIRKVGCKTVLRATADNPFLFYEAATALCDEYFKQNEIQKCDYMTWQGLPHGSGVEIFDAESLLKAAKETSDPYDREHVGPALYNHKNQFTCLFYKAPSRFYYPDFRTTIDTPADYRRAVSVVAKLSERKAEFENQSSEIKLESSSDFLKAASMWKVSSEPYTTEEIISAISEPEVHDTILFVPSTQKGHGTGHLRRCLQFAKEIKAFIYIPEETGLEQTKSIEDEANSLNCSKDMIVRTFPEKNEFALIVADLFKIDQETAKKLRNVSNVLFLDDGGDFSSYADYVLDVIPSLETTRKPNLFAPSFITPADLRRTNQPKNIEWVLVSIGGEDPAELRFSAVRCFALAGKKITMVSSNVEEDSKRISNTFSNEMLKNIFVIPTEPFLRDRLFEYDLIVTHYGLTAFEALSANCAVVLLGTSPLHEKLAKKYQFAFLSREELDTGLPSGYFDDMNKFFPKEITEKISGEEGKKLGTINDFIKKVSHGKRYECPVCQKKSDNEKPDEVVSRTPFRTFRRCSNCSLIYISWNSSQEKKYEKDYFFEQYKNQYGKTYLEDFDSIKKSSIRRIYEINGLFKSKYAVTPKLLDVGCAYGPFLSAAQENGWQVYGTDIAEDPVSYVRKKLLLPAVVSQFPDFDSVSEFGINQFDAVTMWFVIEHFSDLKSVLEKVSSLVKKGGIFAFSTPSAEGISAKKNTDSFFEKSPSDHFSVWEPSKAKKILERFGFTVEKIVSTGHHAERFPSVKKHEWKNGDIMFTYYQTMSKLLKLGDTCEIYCRKNK